MTIFLDHKSAVGTPVKSVNQERNYFSFVDLDNECLVLDPKLINRAHCSKFGQIYLTQFRKKDNTRAGLCSKYYLYIALVN